MHKAEDDNRLWGEREDQLYEDQAIHEWTQR
jgi:hypothetical protein